MTFILLGLFIASLFLFSLFIFMSKRIFRIRNNEKYKLRNFFPYEINEKCGFKTNFAANSALILSICFSIVLFLLVSIYSRYALLIFGCVTACIATIIFGILTNVPLSMLKQHLAFVSIMAVTSLMCPLAVLLDSIRMLKMIEDSPIPILSIIFTSISALFVIVLIFNPKLLSWAKLTENNDANGEIVFSRPKISPLALTEWLIMFNILFNEIILVVYSLIRL